MSNERNTENLVRNMLRVGGYYDDPSIKVEEQKSSNPKIDKLLKTASKGGTGKGYPEFIISFANQPDHIIVVECKADVSKHESKDRKQYKDYAVDGVLLYASYLKDDFTVTAIAVSGETEREKKISTFLWIKESLTYKSIQDKTFLRPSELSNIITEQEKPLSEEELIKKAIEYNETLHKYSIPEVERCTLISSILIALQHKPFLTSYRDYAYTENKELMEGLFSACEAVLKRNHLQGEKTKVIISEYRKFQHNPLFTTETRQDKESKKKVPNTILRDFISSIENDILPHINQNHFDVLGKFYTQFIRYAGSDKKTGLVLTPSHITDFFCEIAELKKTDVVLDPCCGTGGFLVSAMNYMLKDAGQDTDLRKEIKSKQLIGIEQRSDMFTHTCSNMMMRGDGKSHIYHGDCFDPLIKEEIKKQKPNISFLNPPYQDGNSDEQLEFIENALEYLEKGGICIAICQMSTVISNDKKVFKVKERLLEKHTLKAVLSMPNELFNPVAVVTCIIVFESHKAHSQNKETFFGYFKDDGFEKVKNKGRVDINGKWKTIKDQWLKAYINPKNIPGLAVTKVVTAQDEWCAEAYMETDYSNLREEDFIKTIKDYVAFQFLNGDLE